MEILLDDFIRFLTVKGQFEPESLRNITCRYRIFFRWLNEKKLPIDKQSVEMFFYFLKQRGLKNTSINSYVMMIRQLWFFCQDRNLPHENFSDGIRALPHVPSPIEVLTEREIDQLTETSVLYGKFRTFSSEEITEKLNTLYRYFTLFLSRTGARFSEAAKLRCRWVDVWNGKVTFVDTKNKTNRSVWITEPLVSAMKEITDGKKPDDLVFINFLGSRMIPQNYALHLRRAAKRAGILKRVHPHIFRHSFATSLYAATKDIGLVQVVLGHKDIKSTMIYIHLADESIRKGMYRHPYNRNHIDPKEYVSYVEQAVESLRLGEHPRFNPASVKIATGQFLCALYDAILRDSQ